MTSLLEKIIMTLHLMLRPAKGMFLPFLSLGRMLLILLLENLGRFLGCTLVCSILNNANFVEKLRGNGALNIVKKKIKTADNVG